jgi:5-methylthioadenosine/S-adenosylhomocysteine deaminase
MGTVLIENGSVLSREGWLEPGYVWVVGERIEAVGPGKAPHEISDQAGEIISANFCAVLPGLVNAHTHLSQTFMRGLAAGRPLIAWLKELIWPLQNTISPEELHLAALLGLVENLRCGATEVVNHHKVITTTAHTDAVCRAATAVGLRTTLARAWSDRGENCESPAAILADLDRLFTLWHGVDHLKIANGPIALWRCSADMLRSSRELAQRNSSFTHFHVSESLEEVRMSLEETGLRPVSWLDSIDVLGADTQVVHAVWVDENEIVLLAQAGAPVIHCPVSNAVLGSGIAPLAELQSQGVSVRLGTDGPASNDTQDIWESLKTALSFARIKTLDVTVLSPREALRLAMGAEALIPGAPADLIIVNLNHPRAMPVHNIESALALSTHGSDVDTVLVAGQVLMRNRQLLMLDEAALLAECRQAIYSLRKRAGLT